MQHTDDSHDEQRREAFFAKLESPIQYDSLKITICPGSGGTFNSFEVHVSLTAPPTVVQEKQNWIGSLLTAMAKWVQHEAKTRPQKFLVKDAKYRCQVPLCSQRSSSLAAHIHHPVVQYGLPILRRNQQFVDSYQVTKELHAYRTKEVQDGKITFYSPHPALIDTTHYQESDSTDSDGDPNAFDSDIPLAVIVAMASRARQHEAEPEDGDDPALPDSSSSGVAPSAHGADSPQ